MFDLFLWLLFSFILIYIITPSKNYGPITWMKTSIVFVIIIIFVIYLYHPHLHTPQQWSYRVNENFYRFYDYYYPCQTYCIIILIYMNHNQKIWSYYANENFYRFYDYSYPCQKIQQKTTVLSREWEVLSHLW